MKKFRHENHGNQQGITLVELLVAFALSAIISVVLVASFTIFSRTQKSQENIINMQQNIRAAQYFMGREFRMAGYRGANPSSSNARIINANPSFISFTALADDDTIDNNGDAVTDEVGETTSIVYEHYDSNGNGINDAIGRTVDGGTRASVAEHIEELEFYYEMVTGSTTTRSTAPSALTDIKSIRISILARTNRSDQNHELTQSFTTPSGATWGPYTDGRRRRLAETVIRFRNL